MYTALVNLSGDSGLVLIIFHQSFLWNICGVMLLKVFTPAQVTHLVWMRTELCCSLQFSCTSNPLTIASQMNWSPSQRNWSPSNEALKNLICSRSPVGDSCHRTKQDGMVSLWASLAGPDKGRRATRGCQGWVGELCVRMHKCSPEGGNPTKPSAGVYCFDVGWLGCLVFLILCTLRLMQC